MKQLAKHPPSATSSRASNPADTAPWLITAHAGASFWTNMLGGHLGLAVSYQWPYVALGTGLQFTAGSLSDVLVSREQQITSPSLETSYQDGSFFAFTWPVFAGLHFEIKAFSVEIGAGPGLRVTYLSADNMSGITVEPVLHSHVELALTVNRGFRVALRPFVNYAFSGQSVSSFEETQITEPTIVGSQAVIDPLIEGGLSLGFRQDALLSTFLCGMLVRKSHKFIRSAMRARRAMSRVSLEDRAAGDCPESHTMRRLLSEAIDRALDFLSVDQRVAFVLCEVEEKTSFEAALLLGVRPATVRTRLFHAKRKLRDVLEREGWR